MSFSHREVELFQLWAKRAVITSVINDLKLQLKELNAAVDRVQILVNDEKKEVD